MAAKESGIVALSAPNDKSEHFSWRSDSNTPLGRIHFEPVPPGAEGTELVAGFEKVFQFPCAIPGCILGLILGFLLSLWHEKRSASATATALAAQSVEHNESLKTINNMLDGLVEEYGVALNGSASAGSLEALIVAKSRKLIAYFEVRLKQAEALHATMLKLLETSRAGVMRIDSEMRVSWVSNGMESLLGCSGAGLVGRSFNALIQTAEDRTRFSADWKFLAQGSRISQEVNLVAEDGGHILVFLSAMPEYSPEGLFDGASVMLQDRGRLYLARKEEFAREGLDEVSRLAADVAHGFNNALCAIVGGLSLIELKLKTGHPEVMGGSLGDKFDIVSGAAERATLLVRQLMKLAPGVESTAGEAPLGPVLDEVIRALPSTWAIQQAKTDTLLPVVRMNRLLLRSVLTEAITRVREKTDPEKQVRISVSLRDSDDEPGHEPTPPLCCVEVFASQRRVIRNRETGRSGKGEGLKWFETQRLVQDSGGSVVEDSRHLPSTNIVIFLPVTATPRPVVFEGGR
jgi:PAS domain-containing protein